jgi:hypothetical protein
VAIRDVPFIRQKPDFCGEACVAMAWRRLGFNADQDDVFNQSGLDPLEARGCYTREVAAAAQRIGFRTGQVWYRDLGKTARATLEPLWQGIYADLAAGIPSIVCMRYDDRPKTTEHFRLVLGYDAQKDEVLYHEPAVERGAYSRMDRAKFLSLWPLGSEYPRTFVLIRLAPEHVRRPPVKDGFTPADYAQHLMKLRDKVPKGFTVVLQRPFVVIGDERPSEVRRRSEDTVRWAVDRLKAAYFAKDPAEILDIWLFRNSETYEKYCKELFGHAPTTPYGFYSHADKALVMNISTGGGTLVHEIVHPFMAANFPNCPAWFNEGMGSLYEQCGDNRGQIWGYTNWRLPALQQAIRKGRVPTFQKLCATSDHQFYEEDRGTNYAQARYLCYYLEQRGLLQKYYRQFLAKGQDDPGGYKTLQAVLGERDMEAFQKRWEKFVLGLNFPPRE